MIAIVDYGAGNLKSVAKAFQYLGAEVTVTSQPDSLASADKIVLPGVGHFASLSELDRTGLRYKLLESIRAGKPFLGICLGMQWLFTGSEEDLQTPGAGLLSGSCQRFSTGVKSPHVGWNSLDFRDPSRLLRGLTPGSFVYYTHSFCAPICASTTAHTEYGLRFSAAVEKDNVFGVQFHPEKSAQVGLSILRNFCEV
jgi:glutamine amidotransferase